jgi:hypothetical protein
MQQVPSKGSSEQKEVKCYIRNSYMLVRGFKLNFIYVHTINFIARSTEMPMSIFLFVAVFVY